MAWIVVYLGYFPLVRDCYAIKMILTRSKSKNVPFTTVTERPHFLLFFRIQEQ